MITVNGNHLRNMPEQISKNTEDILDLQDAANALDGRVADLENSIISNITLNNLEVTGNTVIGDANTDTLSVTGVSSFNGNVGVTGNVTASGSLAAASASFAGDVVANGTASLTDTHKMLSGSAWVNDFYATEGDIDPTGLIPSPFDGIIHVDLAKWRVSNGKFSLVLMFHTLSTDTVPTSTAVSTNTQFNIPFWVGDKLIFIPNFQYQTIANEEKKFVTTGWSNPNTDISAHAHLQKYTNQQLSLTLVFKNGTSGNYESTCRFELNLIL